MATMMVSVWDATGSKKVDVEVPDDAPVNRILVVLVEKMKMPLVGPDGQRLSYKFHHKASGTQLLDHQTLAQAGVKPGDVLRLQPEITAGAGSAISVAEHRFSRFELITWWSQDKLRNARVLVIGAGALGNEILKNAALLGIGHVVVVDLDLVEVTNLCRSVLFREGDQGRAKAEVAAARARDIHPGMRVHAIEGNAIYDLGLGLFRWADVVLGGLDNREARFSINRACALVGTPWVDGAIEGLSGVARVFRPPEGACYECTLSEADWAILAERRSCALLSRGEMELGKVPTTPTSASVIAGIQCQEAVKLLHGVSSLDGSGYLFDGMGHQSYTVSYRKSDTCESHEALAEIRELDASVATLTGGGLLALAQHALDPGVHLELAREMLRGFECSSCGARERRTAALSSLTEADGRCARCGAARAPLLYHALRPGDDLLDLTLGELGVPPWDIVYAVSGETRVGFLLAADRDTVLGDAGGGS